MHKFSPISLGHLLDINKGGHENIRETFYWPDVNKTGHILSMSESPTTEVVVNSLGRLAQERFNHKNNRTTTTHIELNASKYRAFPPGVCSFRNVIIHSQAGILCFDGVCVSETLWHTAPDRFNYQKDGDSIVIATDMARRLPGVTLSLLGVGDNYFHSVIDGVARLALLPYEALIKIDTILLPSGGIGQSELVRIYNLPPHISVRFVSATDTFHVDYLVFPFSLHGLFDYNPQMNVFFNRILNNLAVKTVGPTHIYIDRRGSGMRRLTNEDNVVSAMADLGFDAVRLENFSQVEQINLFRGAKMIVSPHGAGLTNICFSIPNTSIVELMMDSYVSWCYRRMAAARGLKYDAVLGHALGEWKGLDDGSVHGQHWEINVDEVISTVKTMMN